MSTLAKLLVSLGLDSGDYTKGLADSAQETDSFAKSLLSIGTVAVAAGAIAGTALLGVGIASVKAFGQFETGMSEVFTLLPDLSQSAMGSMTTDVKDFSKEFGVLPEQTIPALYQALSAGVPKDNVFEFLEVAQKAAVGGVTDLEVAVDGITSVINAYGPSVLSASKASDLMFTTVKLGKTNFEQLSSSLFNVIPTAASLGVSFEDVSASLASITLQGTPTSVATTQIRSALVEASKGGTKLSEALIALTGKSFPQLVAGGMDIGTIFDTLRKSMPDQQFKDLFGSVEALNAVLGITGPNAAGFAANLAAMKNSTGATDLAFQTMNQTLGASINKLKAFGAVFLIDIGEKLAPAVALFVNALVMLLNSQFVTDMIEGLGVAIASTVQWLITASTTGIPQFTAAWNTLAAIFMPIIGYFGTIIKDGDTLNDWLTHFPTILQPVIAVLGNYLAVWLSVGNTIATVVSMLMSGDLAGAWEALKIGLGSVVSSYSVYVSSLYALLSGVGQWLLTNLPIWGKAFVDWITPYIPVAIAMLGTFAQAVLNWIAAQISPYATATQSWTQAFVQWVVDAPALVLGYLVAFGTSIVTWISTQATAFAAAFVAWYNALYIWVPPAIEKFLGEWPKMLEGFLDFIGNAVGPILAGFGTWLVGIISWAAQTAPKILAALMKWGVEFAAWIGPALPGMLVALAGLGLAILVWAGQTTFIISKKLVEWGIAFLKWVGDNVLPALPGILMGIGNLIFTFITGAAKTVYTLAMGIGKGIIDGIKNVDWSSLGTWISTKLGEMLAAAKRAILSGSPSQLFANEVGTPIVQGIVLGVSQSAGLLTKAMQTTMNMAVTGAKAVVNNIATVLDQSQLPVKSTFLGQTMIDNIAKAFEKHEDVSAKAKSIGGNAIQGIISGIEGKLGAAVTKAKDAAKKIVDAMAAKLDIKSPSGVFARQVGIPIVMGIMQGMTDKLPTLLAFIGKTGRKILDETLGVMAALTRSSGIDVFKSLLDLEKLDPFQPLVDATEALTAAQQQARGVAENLLDLNAEIAVLQNTPMDQVGDHLKYNEKITALYAKQAILLGEQAQAQANLARLGQTQAEAQAQSAQQQVMINQIADNARKQYEQAQQQALGLMQQDAKGALDFFNKRKAQIAELAQLEKEKALASSDQQRADLDTQIRLTQAAQQAEQTQQAVQVYIGQQDQRAMGDVDIIKIIENALRNAGLSVDIRTRTA